MDKTMKTALDRARETLSGQVFPALREGGLNIPQDETVIALFFDMWARDARKFMLIDVTNARGNRLFVSLVVPPEEDPKDPKVVQVSVGISFVNKERSAGVLFACRTDESWKVSGIDTHTLPEGHMLRHLAHDVRSFNDHRAFRAIMKAARLHRHNTL